MLLSRNLDKHMAKLSLSPPPPKKGCSTNYFFLDFSYVIEQLASFHLVYSSLLLQFVLGATFISPRLIYNNNHVHLPNPAICDVIYVIYVMCYYNTKKD